MFIIIFTGIIYLSGGYESQYKFLFLFIIISTTIQFGVKYGLYISVISSLLILTMDLIMFNDANVNIYFENDLILVGGVMLTPWHLWY